MFYEYIGGSERCSKGTEVGVKCVLLVQRRK